MDKKFVKALLDLHCDNISPAPTYRVYVNDELFVERTYIWDDRYPQEMLQILAEPGRYHIRVESDDNRVYKKNTAILLGPAHWVDSEHLEIKNES